MAMEPLQAKKTNIQLQLDSLSDNGHIGRHYYPKNTVRSTKNELNQSMLLSSKAMNASFRDLKQSGKRSSRKLLSDAHSNNGGATDAMSMHSKRSKLSMGKQDLKKPQFAKIEGGRDFDYEIEERIRLT